MEKNIHGGHRQRMYEKMKNNALLEHEWLEVLLFGMQPRRNTNEVAHRLLRRCGTVEEMRSASLEELKAVDGVGLQIASHLKCIEHFYKHYKKDTSEDFNECYEPQKFISFIKGLPYAELEYEVVDMFLLDGDGFVIKKRGFTTEHISRVHVNPELLSAFCLTEGARGVVMVHNHPSGVGLPSEEDDLMTKNMQVLCSMHNLLLCDHLICAKSGVYSYYISQRLTEISKSYSIQNVIRKE